jgi:hypothetical protein
VGIVTTSSESAFRQSAEEVYAFVTNPSNWPKTYPSSRQVGSVPHELPLKVGDIWTEAGPQGELYTWHLAVAMPPKLWVFNSVGRLGHDADGIGGWTGRITVEYHFTRPGVDISLFRRTMTIEAYKDSPLPDELFKIVNPAIIDQFHAAIARELERSGRSSRD